MNILVFAGREIIKHKIQGGSLFSNPKAGYCYWSAKASAENKIKKIEKGIF